MELEESSTPFEPVVDKRPHMPEPPPVRLLAVADCRLPACAGLERDLDYFYTKVLPFERDEAQEGIVYRAENFRLIFDLVERPPEGEEMMALNVAVRSLAVLMEKLDAEKIDYEHLRGLTLGTESVLLKDPAGNLLNITGAYLVL